MTIIDLVLLLGLGFWFFLGVFQGAIRRLLGIVAMVFAFLIAGNLRGPAGDFLADNWRQFNYDYNRLLAFIIVFVIVLVSTSILIQGFYKRTEISAAHPIVDDAIGGFLGVVEGMLLLLIAVTILSSYPLPDPKSGDVTQLRDVQNILLNQSNICGWLRDSVVPIFIHILAVLLPADLVSLYP